MVNKINLFGSKPKKKNVLINKIVGIGFMVAGIGIWSIDYFIIKALSSIGYWLVELMNAPAEVGIGITILISLLYIGILALVVMIGGFVFWMGIQLLKD